MLARFKEKAVWPIAALLLGQVFLFAQFSHTPKPYLFAFLALLFMGFSLLWAPFKKPTQDRIKTGIQIFAIGGLAMLVGGMIDYGSWSIECQCCRFAMASNMWVPATEEFLSFSSLFMFICCLPANKNCVHQHASKFPVALRYIARGFLALGAMYLSMYLVAFWFAPSISSLGPARTIVMHSAMVGSMALTGTVIYRFHNVRARPFM